MPTGRGGSRPSHGSVNEYKVLLELEPRFQADPKALSLLYFKTPAPNSHLVPLDTLARVVSDTGPQTINHFGQLPAATISFNLRPGASLGDVVSRISDIAENELPATISTQFQGAAKAFQSSLGNLAALLVIAILVVYIVLGILLRELYPPDHDSFRSAFGRVRRAGDVMGVPHRSEHLCVRGVDHADRPSWKRTRSCRSISHSKPSGTGDSSPKKAIYEGCLIRFRPIMMTTMAALLGAVPIALGYGAGGEARRPLGLVVVGGLLFSQLVTLYLTPVLYTYLAGVQGWLAARQEAEAEESAKWHRWRG